MGTKKALSATLLLFILSFIFTGSIAQTTPDPGLPGTMAVSTTYYDLGDLAFKPPSFPDSVEVRGSVHYPTGLPGGPYPVLVFLHGRHETTYETANPGNTDINWPPAAGFQSITSFEGYDYMADQMASHGYIVISVSCNAINANDNSLADKGMPARAELMQHHLDLWNAYNTVGGAPFGTLFVGKLDMNNIGTMGHSRGGEGVVAHALLNRSLGSPYGIKAVITLAPVDFGRLILNGIPLLNIAPYCDGDVSDIQGVHYFDDSRYNDSTDEAPKHTILMMGANHNFFNTVWTPGLYPAGGSDDWDDVYGNTVSYCGSGSSNTKRFTPSVQQAAFKAYASAFYRLYMGNETAFAPILEVDDITPPVSSTLDSSLVFVSYHAPHSKRLDVNREDTENSELFNTLADSVQQNGLMKYDICSDDTGEIDCNVTPFSDKEPHSGSGSTLGMSQLAIRWDDSTDYYVNKIPTASQDFTSHLFLQFRAGVNFSESTSAQDIDFTVQLEDVFGMLSNVSVRNYSNAMYFPPGTQLLELPKVMFNTIKIPLADFTGVNEHRIQKIKFLFNKTTTASILVTDLTLTGNNPMASVPSNSIADQEILVFPNPANDVLTIDAGDLSMEHYSIRLYDVQGKVVVQQDDIQQGLIRINIGKLDKGIYILNIGNQKGSKNVKVVKQ